MSGLIDTNTGLKFGTGLQFQQKIGGSSLDIQTVITSGLVGRWTFLEGSGTTTADVSGNGQTGTLVAAPTWGAGPFASVGSLTFNGSSQYVNLGTAAAVNLTGANSICAWIKHSGNFSASDEAIFDHGYDGTTENLYLVGISANINSGGFPAPGNLSFAASGVTDGSWHLIVSTFTGSAGTLSLYSDNASLQNSSGPLSAPAAATTAHAGIGAAEISASFTRFFNGSISDVRIYNRALSTAEISQIFKGTG